MSPERDTAGVGEVAYWDPISALPDLAGEPRRIWDGRVLDMGTPDSYLQGRWEERNWLNVPGPLYGAQTDSCCCGPEAAPGNILIDEWGCEFVWRQPRTVDELRAVLDAACQDPFAGYAADGDDHWTPDLVIQWWDERERVIRWLTSEVVAKELGAGGYMAAFRDYLDGPLHDDLLRYADWLAAR